MLADGAQRVPRGPIEHGLQLYARIGYEYVGLQRQQRFGTIGPVGNLQMRRVDSAGEFDELGNV